VTLRRPDLVITGQVIVEARPDGIQTAEAIGIAHGEVVAVGSQQVLSDAATPGARVIDAGASAIIPGLHDFHLHLVGMARAKRIVNLTEARTMDQIVEQIAGAAERATIAEWVRGDGWWTEALDPAQLHRLEERLAGRPAYLKSHDRHSAWASRAALLVAGVTDASPDPEGGRYERDARGVLNGLLRERAADLVGDVSGRLAGSALTDALADVVAELAGWGITSVTDAGDPTEHNGRGPYAALGDSFSSLFEAREKLAGRLRILVDLPVAAVPAATELGLRSGTSIGGTTMHVGWAKLYADGALGSRTAALFEPYRCAAANGQPADDTGILRATVDELHQHIRAVRRAGIGLAVHAIGDRAVAIVLDGIEHAGPPGNGAAPDRIEHLQLVRPGDQQRLARLGATASLQPIHLPSDRDTVDACWPDRTTDAYAWRSLAAAGARLAFGSDAPIETANPWQGLFAAVRRHAARDGREPWYPDEGIDVPAALSAYTLGPARAAGRPDIGHLRVGARADLAILDRDLETVLHAGDELATTRSLLTLVDGREVHAQ
jgi:predicted amidohydrolase YtcJ